MTRLTSRAGARLALIQALVVIVAFLVAGCLARVTLEQISQASIRQHIAGEAASLDEEFAQKGAGHLPFTVAKRSRLWRGFDYRLTAPRGELLAGRLPSVGRSLGWTQIKVSSAGGQLRRYLAYTKLMPDGARLTIGEDLAVLAGEMDAITRCLLMCGGLGVVVCVTLSYLFARGTWGRIDALTAAAHAVSRGQLDVRILREGPPRDDLDELGLAFNGMLARIGDLLSQVRQVSTDIAHDLRTPLTRFGHKLERLRKVLGKDPKSLGAVDGLEGDLSEILRTFDALLQLSEIEVSASVLRQRHADLGEILGRVAEAYRPDIEESGRALEVLVEPAIIVEGDGDLLAQCVANLLENALRHTPRGSHIAVMGRAMGDRVEVTVQDDGAGIPAEHRDRALKPFVRLERDRSDRGSGLGLAIVAAVAARHGATLSLEDADPGLRVGLSFKGCEAPAAASVA